MLTLRCDDRLVQRYESLVQHVETLVEAVSAWWVG
jgi:hypothetical protein